MPIKPQTVCECGAIRVNGICPKCKPKTRPSAHKRGYDRTWRKKTEHLIAENPLYWLTCQDCGKTMTERKQIEFHHMEKVADNPDKRLDESNLLPLCERCHSIRTRRGE